ncbi:hypothetical protein ACR0S4_24195 [Priestia megaterium]|uniref:hypothetical protein n=1 Tax=Priestia megaterium TaxID=1404 RepID=UPI003D996F24
MAMANHQVSMRLEMAARSALSVQGRGALHGVIDADYIDRIGAAFTVLIAAVSPYYKDADAENRALIESFLDRYSFLGESDVERERYTKGVDSAATELRELIRTF